MRSAARSEFAVALGDALHRASRRGLTQKDLARRIARAQTSRRRLPRGPEREAELELTASRWAKKLSAWKQGDRLPADQAELMDAIASIDPDGQSGHWLARWNAARLRTSEQEVPSPGIIATKITNPTQPVHETVQDELTAPTRDRDPENSRLRSLIDEAIDEIEATGLDAPDDRYIKTGLSELDRLTGGLRRGQLVVLASEPGVGKTTLAINLAHYSSVRQGIPSAFFTMETNRNEITFRLLAAESRIPLTNIRKGMMRDEDWSRLARSMADVSNAPLHICDPSDFLAAEIFDEARKLHAKSPLFLMVIDSLQILAAASRFKDRKAGIQGLCYKLKALAQELNSAVVIVSHLERHVGHEEGFSPTIDQLGEFGELETFADMIILLHREDHYVRESIRAGEANLIIVQNRHGPRDVIRVAFQGHYARFIDLSPR